MRITVLNFGKPLAFVTGLLIIMFSQTNVQSQMVLGSDWQSEIGDLILTIESAHTVPISDTENEVQLQLIISNNSQSYLDLTDKDAGENFLISDPTTGKVYWAQPSDDFPPEFPPGEIMDATLIINSLPSEVANIDLNVLDMTGPIEARFETFKVTDIPLR